MRRELLPEEKTAVVRIRSNTVHIGARRLYGFRRGAKRVLFHAKLNDLHAEFAFDCFSRVFRPVSRYLPDMLRNAINEAHFLNSRLNWATSWSVKKRHSPVLSA